MKRLVVAVLALGVVGGGGYWYYRYSRKPVPPTVTTAAVTRGDIVESVGATGTLQAVTTVQVGSQVSGNIAFLGADFNSIVKKGQVLARLDPSLFQAQVQQSQANLAQARANFAKAQSELERNRVQLTDAQQKYARAKELSSRKLLAQSDLDAAKTAVDTAEAAVASQQATVTQSQAAINQSQASLNQNEVNLEHTVITAPIDGLVISRNVDVGQTVAASMQAPTLFVLAADLTKMQVVANLDESDVGRIRPNQLVTFRVDAYPNDTFRGTVSQVRLQPVVQQNVVTYATVIDVPNNDLRLKPGMTANVNVEISRASNVLRVPNSSLRFRPSNEIFAALGQTPPEPQGRGSGPGGRNANGGNGRPAPSDQPSTAPQAQAGGSASGRASGADPQSPRDRTAVPPQTADGKTPRSGNDSGSSEGSAGDPAGAERRNRLAERLQAMSPEDREAAMARMRERGIDPNNPGGGGGGFGRGGRQTADAQTGSAAGRRGGAAAPPAAPSVSKESGATTIDALFAPLPRTETFGRAWTYLASKLQPVRLRLGISDGQNTELIEGDLKEGSEVVTNITIAGQTTRPATTAFPGFGGRGGFGGGGNRGGGPGPGR